MKPSAPSLLVAQGARGPVPAASAPPSSGGILIAYALAVLERLEQRVAERVEEDRVHQCRRGFAAGSVCQRDVVVE